LGIPLDQIEIGGVEQVEWSDGCLGLGGPAESCLAAITPGWRVELHTQEGVTIARTDELGNQVRFEDTDASFPIAPPISQPPVDGSIPEAVLRAREVLAKQLGISPDKIEIVTFEQKSWPNGCLGLAKKGEMCTMALVNGWRVELSTDGQSFIARTNETGSAVRFE
jgi:hypothetical protein